MTTGITGINGFVGGSLYEFFKNSRSPALGLSTAPRTPDIVRLQDGVPQGKFPEMDSIVHCGGLVGEGYKAGEYRYANVECTERLLQWCGENGIRQFVFFSTGGVYGEREGWVDETAELNPRGLYSESKVLAEEKVGRSGIPAKTILRLYFPIGELRYKHLFSRLARAVRDGKEVFLNDEAGRPRISPIWINDVCRIVAELLGRKLGGVYNLSANAAITIGEVVELMSSLFGTHPKKNIRNIPSADFLGKADKVIAAAGGIAPAQPRDAIRSVVAGFQQTEGRPPA